MLTNLLIILLAILGIYCIMMSQIANKLSRNQQWGRLASFTLGLLVALPVFIPSPDFFGPDHRFTVSMGQMLLALDLVPVLLYLGTPPVMLQPLLRWRHLRHLVAKPLPAGIASSVLFVVWFIPLLFGAASSNLAVWLIKQFLFLVSGLIFWWPVAGPLPIWRPIYPLQMVYILVMKVPMAGLGIGFTFADKLIYLSRSFSLEICAPSSITDQQTGGLIIMFVGGLILFIAFTIVFFRWAAAEETEEKYI